MKVAWTSQIIRLDSRLDAASACLLPGRRMKLSTWAAVIHLLCPPRGRRCRIQIASWNILSIKGGRLLQSDLISPECTVHAANTEPSRFPCCLAASCSFMASPQGGLRSPWQLAVHLSQWTSLTSRRHDAVRSFMKLPVASRAPGAVPDNNKNSARDYSRNKPGGCLSGADIWL